MYRTSRSSATACLLPRPEWLNPRAGPRYRGAVRTFPIARDLSMRGDDGRRSSLLPETPLTPPRHLADSSPGVKRPAHSPPRPAAADTPPSKNLDHFFHLTRRARTRIAPSTPPKGSGVKPAKSKRSSRAWPSQKGFLKHDANWMPNGHAIAQEWVKTHKQLLASGHTNLSDARRAFEPQRRIAQSFFESREAESGRRDNLRDVWLRLTPARRAELLVPVLIGSLVDSAQKTLLMLSTVPKQPREWKVRCECLLYLDQHHREEIDSSAELQTLFDEQIHLITSIWLSDQPSLPRAFLALLLRHNNPHDCDRVIRQIFETHDPVPVALILVMADHYTKCGEADHAIELLSKIPVAEREASAPLILERFANLAKLDTIEASISTPSFKILPRLVEFGIPMDERMHNVIIEKATSLGWSDAAWEVFRYMQAEHIAVDARNHLILLRDSFLRNDREKLDEIMSAIHRQEDLYTNPHLVAYMMHIVRVVCCVDRKLPPVSTWLHILAVYDRVYDRSPLVKLNLADSQPGHSEGAPALPPPPPKVLAFTVWAYLLAQQDERPVSRLWHWIVHLIKDQDSIILQVAKHDVLYNGFVHFYSRRPATLRNGVHVIENMIDLGLCSPTELTWSHIICGFLRHGDEQAAETIWQTMISRGLQPTQAGWEFLLSKYGNAQLAHQIQDLLDERQVPPELSATLGLDGNSANVE